MPTSEQLTDVFKHRTHLRAGLPLRVSEHAKAHEPAVGWRVIADIWMVDLRFERDCRWFERIVRWQRQFDLEFPSLVTPDKPLQQ